LKGVKPEDAIVLGTVEPNGGSLIELFISPEIVFDERLNRDPSLNDLVIELSGLNKDIYSSVKGEN
jgi:hypothetical protein